MAVSVKPRLWGCLANAHWMDDCSMIHDIVFVTELGSRTSVPTTGLSFVVVCRHGSYSSKIDERHHNCLDDSTIWSTFSWQSLFSIIFFFGKTLLFLMRPNTQLAEGHLFPIPTYAAGRWAKKKSIIMAWSTASSMTYPLELLLGGIWNLKPSRGGIPQETFIRGVNSSEKLFGSFKNTFATQNARNPKYLADNR